MSDRFKSLVNDITSEISLKKKILEEQEARIEEEKTKLEKEKETMSSVTVSDSDIVHLNVGGRLFTTRRGSLRLVEGSVLELMFSGRWENRIECDKSGNAFLDLNPTLFDILLRFLSAMHTYGLAANHIRVQPVPQDLEDEFRLMVNFLGLTNLLSPKVPFMFSKVLKSSAVELSENQMRCFSDSFNGAVRHYALSENVYYDGGLYRFSATIEHLEDWLLLGIIGEDVLIGSSQDPCTLSKAYGFGTDGQVFVNGVESKVKGYPGRCFGEGDSFELILDCRYKFFALYYTVDDQKLEYKIPGLEEGNWRFMVCTYFGSSVVRMKGL